MELEITEDIMNRIFAHAEKDAPIEACGYLAGKKITDGRTERVGVNKIYSMYNVDKSEEHFSFDPEEQFKVVRDARKKELDLVAVYHSHPASPARLSEEDKKLAFDPDMIYLIVSLENNRKHAKAFSIKHGEWEEVPVRTEN